MSSRTRVIWQGKAIRLIGLWDEDEEREEVVLEVANGTDRLGTTRWQDADEDLDPKLARRTIRELAAGLSFALRHAPNTAEPMRLQQALPTASFTPEQAVEAGLLPAPLTKSNGRALPRKKAEA